MVIIYRQGAEVLRPSVREDEETDWIQRFNELPAVQGLQLQAMAVIASSQRPAEVLRQIQEQFGLQQQHRMAVATAER